MSRRSWARTQRAAARQERHQEAAGDVARHLEREGGRGHLTAFWRAWAFMARWGAMLDAPGWLYDDPVDDAQHRAALAGFVELAHLRSFYDWRAVERGTCARLAVLA